jgi:CHAT domain-containing protein
MFVPLHAAGVYEGSKQECCADYAVSSYTPTVAAVLRHPHTVSSIMTNQARLAAFAAEDGHNKTLPRLNHARAEVEAVVNAAERAHVFVDRSVAATPASIESVIGALSSANIAHLACHGVQDATDALSSGFCLTDGMLTVSQLMKIPRGSPFLAFLSACETAKGDREQPDQLIHLAATMLFLGFRSVIATMW